MKSKLDVLTKRRKKVEINLKIVRSDVASFYFIKSYKSVRHLEINLLMTRGGFHQHLHSHSLAVTGNKIKRRGA